MTLHLPTTLCEGHGFCDDKAYHGSDYLSSVSSLKVKVQQWMPPKAGLAPAHACDLFEWQLLAGQGGWYSDLDILYVRPMPGVGDVDAVWCLEGDEMAIGLFGSAGNDSVFQSIHRQAKTHQHARAYQCAGVEAVYRVAGLWPMVHPDTSGKDSLASIHRRFPQSKILVLPTDAIYMRCWREAKLLYRRDDPPPKTAVGVHWYGGLSESHQASLSWTPTWQGPSRSTLADLARLEAAHPLPPILTTSLQ